MIDTDQQRAILTVSLMAAFADGAKHDAERAELKRIAERLPHPRAIAPLRR